MGAFGLLGGAMAGGLPGWALAAGSADDLVIWGPPVGPSIALAHLVENSEIQNFAPGATFKTWRTPDQLRAGMTSGKMKISVVPSYTGANLYNRGLPLRMLNIMTFGLLYMMSRDESVTSLDKIAGHTVVMPFKNDMPDLVFKHITQKAGLVQGRDFKIQYVSTPLEAVQFLLTKRATLAIIPEPAATAAQLKGLKNAVGVSRAFSLQDEWGKATGRPPRIPQAGALVHEDLLEHKPDLVKAIQTGSMASTEWVNNNPASAGRLAQDYLGLGAPVIEKSIPYSNLETKSAADTREELEFFFSILAEQSPAIIGGKMPEQRFYLAV